jgi:hypothetical protein
MKLLISAAIFVVFMILGCENNIQGPEDDANPPPAESMSATFTSIQNELFSTTCAKSGCHAGLQNPDLSVGKSYGNLVNVASLANPSLLRVKPFDSENSYLIRKLRGEGTTVMPPAGQLSAAVIDSVVAWIDRGALNN